MSQDDMGVGRAMNLTDRIEAATVDQQRELLVKAWQAVGNASFDWDDWHHPDTPDFHRWSQFQRKLDAKAYLDAAMMLVGKDWFVEVKGPRRYLNIPTPVPNHWSANLETWDHEGQKMGWGATPALALAAAAIRAKGIDDG